MSPAPPPGVKVWNASEGSKAAKKNAIISIYGTTKVGKSQFATRATGPLYIIHYDPNDNLDEHLLAREAAGFTGDVYPIKCPPIPYKLLTEEKAGEYVKALEDFAAWARIKAREDEEAGRPTGVFIIDGGRKLKGYIEKWKLGESATLGYRAQRGDRGVSQVQYAETNAYLADIINGFVGSPLHLIITFEGKEPWVDYRDEDGKKARKPGGKIVTTMPAGTSYSLNAQVEAFVEEVPIIADNKRVGTSFENKIRIDYIGFVGMSHLRGRTLKAMSFDALLDLLHSKIPAEEVLDEPHEIVRANMAGLETEDE